MGESSYIYDMLGCEDDYGFESDYGPPYEKKRLEQGPGKCSLCNSKTILKEGKYGKFYGCENFPKCNGTRKYLKWVIAPKITYKHKIQIEVTIVTESENECSEKCPFLKYSSESSYTCSLFQKNLTCLCSGLDRAIKRCQECKVTKIIG